MTARPALLLAFCSVYLPAQTYTVLAHLNTYRDPVGGFAQGPNGQLYATTDGGPSGVFEMTRDGRVTILDGLPGGSMAGLLLATDGNFYGTTVRGGAHRAGSIFQVTPKGSLTTIYSFFCSKKKQVCRYGAAPTSPLIQARNGNIYGTTPGGGIGCPAHASCGTVFKLTLTGKLTTLHTFCVQPGCPDGGQPAGIIQSSDGNFYGATYGSGTHVGTVFRLAPDGPFKVLHPANGALAPPVQAIDGNLYGTTTTTVYRVTLGGAFETLYTFCSQPNCTDGRYADTPLIQATDGNFYGTTYNGGANNTGTIFKVTADGTLTTVYSFCAFPGCSQGFLPQGPLFQATDGNLYGTTTSTAYRLSMGLAPFVSVAPASANVGGSVAILGYGLAGATAVTFGGTPASFTVNSTGSAIAATVPEGAASGTVAVTLADGSVLSSNLPFQVRD